MNHDGVDPVWRRNLLLTAALLCVTTAIGLGPAAQASLMSPRGLVVAGLTVLGGWFGALWLRDVANCVLVPSPGPWFARRWGLAFLLASLAIFDLILFLVDSAAIAPACPGLRRQISRLLAATGAVLIWIPLLDWTNCRSCGRSHRAPRVSPQKHGSLGWCATARTENASRAGAAQTRAPLQSPSFRNTCRNPEDGHKTEGDS